MTRHRSSCSCRLLQDLEIQLRSVAYFTVSGGKSPQVFAQQTKTLARPPGTSIALVDVSTPTPTVLLAVGGELHQGQRLPSSLSTLTARATATLSSAILQQGSDRLLALAAAPAVYPHVVCLETTVVHPDKPVPNTSAAYSHIYVNVYASPHRDPAESIASTFGPEPLPTPVANVVLRLGSIHWLVSAAQKEPLSGPYATATPWIALGVGLVVALALALVFELLARRQRHTERIVIERTAELLAAQEDLVRSERLAAFGEFATVVGHELRNPLGAAINDLFLLRVTAGERLDADSETHIHAGRRADLPRRQAVGGPHGLYARAGAGVQRHRFRRLGGPGARDHPASRRHRRCRRFLDRLRRRPVAHDAGDDEPCLQRVPGHAGRRSTGPV